MTAQASHRAMLLTPPGSGAIGVVRVVGHDASSLVAKLFRARSGKPLAQERDDRLRYGWLVEAGERIDDVIVSHAPRCTPPAIDICVHGGVRVIERVLMALDRGGAPLVENDADCSSVWPAANSIEHEVVDGLLRARTARAVRFLGWQRTHLVNALERSAALCQSDPRQARIELEGMLAGYPAARTLLEGATVAIVGPTNSGKSTLLNLLVGRSAALVSPRSGTTRDWVASPVEMEGVPLTLVDTAGHVTSGDALERRAIIASRKRTREADLSLVVLDGSVPLADQAHQLWAHGLPLGKRLLLINKLDAGVAWDSDALHRRASSDDPPILRISAKTGDGVDKLVRALLTSLGFTGWTHTAPCLFTMRQTDLARSILSDLGGEPPKAKEAIEWRLIGG